MKISEYITALTAIQSEHGDLELYKIDGRTGDNVEADPPRVISVLLWPRDRMPIWSEACGFDDALVETEKVVHI